MSRLCQVCYLGPEVGEISPHRKLINRSLLVIAGSLLLPLLPRGFAFGPSLMLTAIGFSEAFQAIPDPGPVKPITET